MKEEWCKSYVLYSEPQYVTGELTEARLAAKELSGTAVDCLPQHVLSSRFCVLLSSHCWLVASKRAQMVGFSSRPVNPKKQSVHSRLLVPVQFSSNCYVFCDEEKTQTINWPTIVIRSCDVTSIRCKMMLMTVWKISIVLKENVGTHVSVKALMTIRAVAKNTLIFELTMQIKSSVKAFISTTN